MDVILEQAKLDFTAYLRDCVDGILSEWDQPLGKIKALGLFLEFNFPFVNLGVRKILKERHPNAESASKWLKENPQYPIDAYLVAEATAWIAFQEKYIISSLFPITEMAEIFFLHDLKWYCKLLIAVTEAIEKQMKIDPKASMPKLLQDWCLKRDNLTKPPSKWLGDTPDGEAKSREINRSDKASTPLKERIRISAAQENERRREIFYDWQACWRAELRGLNLSIRLRERGQEA
jgi:hypothetical protein